MSTEPENVAAREPVAAADPLLQGASPRLYNEDLAPITERTWAAYSLFAMWMADVHSIGGYTFAAGLFFLGLVAWEVFLALSSASRRLPADEPHGVRGQRHGIPFRSSRGFVSGCSVPT